MIPFLAIMVINTMWYNTMTDYLPWNQKYSWLLLLHVWTVTTSIGLSLFQMIGPTYGWLRKTRLYGITLHRWNGIVIYGLMIIGLISGAALARVQRYFQFNNVWYLDITDLNLLLIPSVGGYMTYAIYKMRCGDIKTHRYYMARALFYSVTIYSTSRIVIYSVLAANGIYPTWESIRSFRWIRIQPSYLPVLGTAIEATVWVTFGIITLLELYLFRETVLRVILFPFVLLATSFYWCRIMIQGTMYPHSYIHTERGRTERVLEPDRLVYSPDLDLRHYIDNDIPVILTQVPPDIALYLKDHFPCAQRPNNEASSLEEMQIVQYAMPRVGPLDTFTAQHFGQSHLTMLVFSGRYDSGLAHIDSCPTYNVYYMSRGSKKVVLVHGSMLRYVSVADGLDNVYVVHDKAGWESTQWLENIPEYYQFEVHAGELLLFNNGSTVHKFGNLSDDNVGYSLRVHWNKASELIVKKNLWDPASAWFFTKALTSNGFLRNPASV
jgi:uncharacterized membrane protein